MWRAWALGAGTEKATDLFPERRLAGAARNFLLYEAALTASAAVSASIVAAAAAAAVAVAAAAATLLMIG